MLKTMRKILTVGLLLLLTPHANGAESADYCRDFFNEANYLPYLKVISKSFNFNQDNGIEVDKKMIARMHLVHYASDASHRIESDPLKAGPLKGIKEGVQLTSESSDPKSFKITEDFLEHYRENFLSKPAMVKPPPTPTPPPLQMHIFEYTMSFRNGICVPTSVVEIGPGYRKSLFDFDQCSLADGNQLVSKDLDCHRLAVYRKILADKRFDHSSVNSKKTESPTVQ